MQIIDKLQSIQLHHLITKQTPFKIVELECATYKRRKQIEWDLSSEHSRHYGMDERNESKQDGKKLTIRAG